MIVAQIVQVPHVLDGTQLFSADGAEDFFRLNAVAMVVAAALAVVVPARWRWVLVLLSAVPLAGVLAVCVIGVPIRGWSLVVGLLTLAACWEVGERALRGLGADELAALVPTAWLAGVGLLTAAVLCLGRLSVTYWFTGGLLIILVGATGLTRLCRRGLPHRSAVREATSGTALATACAVLVLLDLAWLAVYTFAPEMGFDPLSAKGWLPQFWAAGHGIDAVHSHPQFATAGDAQVLAVPGHTLGAGDVGRWMQYGTGVAITSTVWWWGRRFGALGPIAALATVASPTFAFQAGTADDDLLLVFGAIGLVLAVYTLLDQPRADRAAFRTGVALGLLGGAVLTLKLHLAYLDAAMLGGWVLAGGVRATALARAGGVAVGTVLTAALPFATRIIDYQNPVFPAYNNVFRSKYWPPVNEHFNFPFWPDAPRLGILTWPWESLKAANPLIDIGSPGFLGLLLAGAVGGLFMAVPAWRARPTRVVWVAMTLALLCWYLQLRYLRYLMPVAFIGILLVLAVVRVQAFGRWAERAVIVAIAAFAVAVFPSQMAQYTSTPQHRPPLAAARGSWAEDAFLRTIWPERDAINVLNRVTPRGARILSGNYQRLWLSQRRDLMSIGEALLLPGHGPAPVGPEALRRRLAAVGVHFMTFSRGPGFAPEPDVQNLMDAKGELVWADRNWEVWHLAARPVPPTDDPACDPLLRAGSCWAAPALDARPGLTAGEAGAGATTTVPTCPGQTVTVKLTVPAGGPPAHVQIDAQTPGGLGGKSGADVPPGSTRLVGTTTPPGASLTNVAITPGPGGSVTRAQVGRTGPRC